MSARRADGATPTIEFVYAIVDKEKYFLTSPNRWVMDRCTADNRLFGWLNCT